MGETSFFKVFAGVLVMESQSKSWVIIGCQGSLQINSCINLQYRTRQLSTVS
jgi:hypothetical protein